MATMYGADVEQLRALATQFDRSADRLDADRMSVGNAIRISAWMGPVAMRFRAQWDSDHSRRLYEASQRLRGAASSLRANADDQARTSAVGGGGGSGTPGLGALGSPGRFDDSTQIPEWEWWGKDLLPGFDWLLPLPGILPGDQQPGRFDWVFDSTRQVLDAELPGSGWSVEDFGGLVPGVGTGMDIFGGIEEIRAGNVPWHQAIDIAAGAARSTGPIGFALGWTAGNVADGIDLAINQTDWSAQGMQDLWDGARSAEGWKAVGHDMVTVLPKLLAGNMSFW